MRCEHEAVKNEKNPWDSVTGHDAGQDVRVEILNLEMMEREKGAYRRNDADQRRRCSKKVAYVLCVQNAKRKSDRARKNKTRI